FGRSYGRFVRGTLSKDGEVLPVHDVAAAVRGGLAYVPEDRKTLGLLLDEDIRRNTTLAALHRVSRHGVIDQARETVEARRMGEELRVRGNVAAGTVRTLSGGNQQKVV